MDTATSAAMPKKPTSGKPAPASRLVASAHPVLQSASAFIPSRTTWKAPVMLGD